eukprot:CAMPEP_0198220984 /NCGR_PEP_ID=MMETSP1445-20131203/81664_1 /TAXON_ID=36898 /ORGANISM="Pyramimonas sp., Strain CCMP2087" /LENGTH=68 /DNA_ID=CAMNT_0043898943 /DNA_START=75 /DNA_END=277 /DNA_ORIENTATION=-
MGSRKEREPWTGGWSGKFDITYSNYSDPMRNIQDAGAMEDWLGATNVVGPEGRDGIHDELLPTAGHVR